jgi:hypothetical protein
LMAAAASSSDSGSCADMAGWFCGLGLAAGSSAWGEKDAASWLCRSSSSAGSRPRLMLDVCDRFWFLVVGLDIALVEV